MIMMFETQTRTVPITKEMVRKAYRKVRSNKGASGVDGQNLAAFEEDLLCNLYIIWNRLSSGSYFPQAVRSVAIPKSDGKQRILGIPTVSDRIAQQVVKDYLEPRLEKVFHKNSYGYRPLKSAHDAVQAVYKNVRQYGWVIDMDIKAYFDEVNHELLMKALDKHVEEKWVKLYIKRWLEVPSQTSDGIKTYKDGTGTPQGGVISPLLANLYLHYVLDKCIERHYPGLSFVRYADDVIVHCYTEEQAKEVLAFIKARLLECKLRLNETKTKIVYCKDYRRASNDYEKKFDFLGFSFKPQTVRSKTGRMFLGYGFEISQKAQTRIIESWKEENWHRRSELTIVDIAERVNKQHVGIIRYYGKFKIWTLQRLFFRFEYRLVKWLLNKYKHFKGSKSEAYKWIKQQKKSYPTMFYYWTVLKHV
jgi:group II intron reverse transcriptase/maturase